MSRRPSSDASFEAADSDSECRPPIPAEKCGSVAEAVAIAVIKEHVAALIPGNGAARSSRRVTHRSSRLGASIITGDQIITAGLPSRIGGKASRPWFKPAHGVVLGDLALQFNWIRRAVSPTNLRKVELEAYRRFAPFDS